MMNMSGLKPNLQQNLRLQRRHRAKKIHPSKQPQPETDGQTKQPKSSMEFNIADVDLKKVLNRDNTPKKE